jgi:hypothetical protein
MGPWWQTPSLGGSSGDRLSADFPDKDHPMPGKPITIKTFDNSIQAHLARNCLVDAGIPATLSDENLVGTHWALSNAVGGIRLQVPEDDVARAKALLDAEPDERASDIEPDEAEPSLSRREDDAERAFRGAVVGALFWPLQFYVFWLLLRVYLSDDALRGRHRSRAIWAAVINIPIMLAMATLFRALPAS